MERKIVTDKIATRPDVARVVSQILRAQGEKLRADAMVLGALWPEDPAAEYGARVLEHVAGILAGRRES